MIIPSLSISFFHPSEISLLLLLVVVVVVVVVEVVVVLKGKGIFKTIKHFNQI